MPVKRISDAQRQELRDALGSGTVSNISAYADAYAAANGLNRNTVRSALTRMRREIADAAPISVPLGAPGTGLTTYVLTADASMVAHIGAVALERYERDPEFKRAADRLRRENAPHFQELWEIRERLAALPSEERRTLIQSMNVLADPSRTAPSTDES